jgi:prepilin-type processing-associated H-X9-DG protein
MNGIKDLLARIRGHREEGFTRLDLIAALTTVALLGTLQLAVLGHARSGSRTTQCLHNFHQLTQAWLLYTEDTGKLVGNYYGLDAQGGPTPNSWATGWLDWTTQSDNTNTEFLINPSQAKLASYVGKHATYYKCTVDKYLSMAQESVHMAQRVRSCSLNVSMGYGGDYKSSFHPYSRVYLKLSDLVYLPPYQAAVFIEEQADSICDPCFLFNPMQARWLRLPAAYHDGAGLLSFADGHVERHAWTEAETLRAQPVKYIGYHTQALIATNADYLWLKARIVESYP